MAEDGKNLEKLVHTLDSVIDVGQGINVGHGKFGKNLRSFVMKKMEKIIFLIFDT